MLHDRLQFFHPNPATIPQYKHHISQRYTLLTTCLRLLAYIKYISLQFLIEIQPKSSPTLRKVNKNLDNGKGRTALTTDKSLRQ